MLFPIRTRPVAFPAVICYNILEVIFLKNYCVYCHTTPSNRKYVGISCDPRKRWNEGKGYSKNYVFYRAIRKYGWENIRHDILFDGLSLEEAKEVETRLISEWKLTDRKYGYNLVSEKDGICMETHRRMSEAQKGNTNSKGRKLSNDTRQKISLSLKTFYSNPKNRAALSRKHTEATKAKLRSRIFSTETREKMSKSHYDCSGLKNPSAKAIVQLSLSGELIREYGYANQASKECNLDLSSIIKCCRGKQKTCGGYRWKYK